MWTNDFIYIFNRMENKTAAVELLRESSEETVRPYIQLVALDFDKMFLTLFQK